MPNWVNKTAKRTAVAAPGETLHAALFCRPARDDGSAKRLGAPAGTLGKMVDNDAAGATDGVAADMPAVNAVLAITESKLVAFGHGSLLGRVKGELASWPLADVASIELTGEPGAVGTNVAVTFADGSSFAVVPGTRAKRFVEAFAERVGA